MLVCKHKEALGFGGTEGAKPLIDALVSVLHLIQHNAHDDHVCDCQMLQEIHLCYSRDCLSVSITIHNTGHCDNVDVADVCLSVTEKNGCNCS